MFCNQWKVSGSVAEHGKGYGIELIDSELVSSISTFPSSNLGWCVELEGVQVNVRSNTHSLCFDAW